MKSQTSLVAQQTRLREWAEQIRDCNNRPHGMTVDDWCQSRGITKANYYWRLRKVREELLKAADSTPAFVELKNPASKEVLIENHTSAQPKTAAVIRTGKWSIEITDLRRGIDGLARIIRFQFKLDPYDKNTLFLFCGKKTDRIKGLLWEGDGFLLLYKRIENGSFKWPRTADEVMEITPQQYQMLMHGLEIVARHPIEEVKEPAYAM